jgi:hypothetical protein
MKKLINQIKEEYQQALKLDPENTDALFFILDEIAELNDLAPDQYDELTKLINKEIN